jgi:hypothetical protein|tara:strand:+ start:787 stop:1152 length:366 start_codon:yes stop_codon:yes gene_type:complete
MIELNLGYLPSRLVWNVGVSYWTDEMKAKQSEVGKRVMSCPIRRQTKAELMSETMKKSWASGKRDTSTMCHNRKPVMTPYGEFPSALQAAKEIAPKLGVKPSTIQAYIGRDSEKYKEWYYA